MFCFIGGLALKRSFALEDLNPRILKMGKEPHNAGTKISFLGGVFSVLLSFFQLLPPFSLLDISREFRR